MGVGDTKSKRWGEEGGAVAKVGDKRQVSEMLLPYYHPGQAHTHDITPYLASTSNSKHMFTKCSFRCGLSKEESLVLWSGEIFKGAWSDRILCANLRFILQETIYGHFVATLEKRRALDSSSHSRVHSWQWSL